MLFLSPQKIRFCKLVIFLCFLFLALVIEDLQERIELPIKIKICFSSLHLKFKNNIIVARKDTIETIKDWLNKNSIGLIVEMSFGIVNKTAIFYFDITQNNFFS